MSLQWTRGAPRSVRVGIVLATLALSALFLAQGVNDYVAGTLLSAAQATSGATQPNPPLSFEPPDRCAILARNMFDSASGALCPPKAVAPPEPALVPRAPQRDHERRKTRPSGITAVSNARFRVQRALIDSVLRDPAGELRSIRAVPYSRQGKLIGVKLYGIQGDSLLHVLGLQNDDVLLAINGLEIATPDAALEAYARLRSASKVSVSLERGGRPMIVDYSIE